MRERAPRNEEAFDTVVLGSSRRDGERCGGRGEPQIHTDEHRYLQELALRAAISAFVLRFAFVSSHFLSVLRVSVVGFCSRRVGKVSITLLISASAREQEDINSHLLLPL